MKTEITPEELASIDCQVEPSAEEFGYTDFPENEAQPDPKLAPDEPKPIREVVTTIADFIDHCGAELKRDPENTYTLGICRHCGASLGNTEEDKVISIGRAGFLPNVCCQACSDIGKARLAAEAVADRDNRFAGVVPTEFRSWDSSKGNNKALAAATGLFSISARIGVILHGPSGRCKTRVMWELVKRVAGDKDNLSFHVLDAFEAASTGIPKDAYMADFLFIDDLGNEPKAHKFETQLLHLFRRRFDWHKPISVTTQLTGRDFVDRYFNGSAGQAVRRRITERCKSVDCVIA